METEVLDTQKEADGVINWFLPRVQVGRLHERPQPAQLKGFYPLEKLENVPQFGFVVLPLLEGLPFGDSLEAVQLFGQVALSR